MSVRIIPCENCGGDGGWSVESTFDPFRNSIGYRDIECSACGGTGEYEVEPEPIGEDDLDECAPTVGATPTNPTSPAHQPKERA